MTYQIGQIPTHYTPANLTPSYKIEVENPTGPASGYTTLAELALTLNGSASLLVNGNVNVAQTNSSVASVAASIQAHVPAGSLIVVVAAETTTGGAGSSAVTDSAGNTYTALDTLFPNNSNANGFMRVWTCANCLEIKSPGWIRYAAAATGKSIAALALFLSTPNQASPIDTTSNATATGSSTTVAVTEGVPTAAGEITLGMFLATGASANTFTAPTGDFSATGTRAAMQLGFGQTNLLLYVNLITNELGTARALASTGTSSPWCAKVIALL